MPTKVPARANAKFGNASVSNIYDIPSNETAMREYYDIYWLPLLNPGERKNVF